MNSAKQIDELPLNSYNRIASFYDLLADLAFFGALTRAQKAHLDLIPQGASILIIGGGTGRILRDLQRSHPASKIVFLDASSEMITQAKARVSNGANIEFIHGRLGEIPQEGEFSVVICNFFLDQFSNEDCASIVEWIQRKLKRGGLLLVSDFVADASWKRSLIQLMYRTLAALGAVKPKRFPDWKSILANGDLTLMATSTFYFRFICSVCYRTDSRLK